MPKKRQEAVKRGCLDKFENPTQACIKLGEYINNISGLREFTCKDGFPQNCNREMKEIDQKWKNQLVNLKKYAG